MISVLTLDLRMSLTFNLNLGLFGRYMIRNLCIFPLAFADRGVWGTALDGHSPLCQMLTRVRNCVETPIQHPGFLFHVPL